MEIHAILFDLDGTLLNTLDDLADSMNRVLARRGIPTHPVDNYRHFVGEGARVLAARVLPAEILTPDLADQVHAEYITEYGSNWDAKTKPYPGMIEALHALRERKLRLAVLSNKPHEFTVPVIETLLPGIPFEAVYGHRPEYARKPDPMTALMVAREMDLVPESFAYVGDTATDMETARAAGMYPIGVLWGFRDHAELTHSGAAAIINHPDELPPLIDRLRHDDLQ